VSLPNGIVTEIVLKNGSSLLVTETVKQARAMVAEAKQQLFEQREKERAKTATLKAAIVEVETPAIPVPATPQRPTVREESLLRAAKAADDRVERLGSGERSRTW